MSSNQQPIDQKEQYHFDRIKGYQFPISLKEQLMRQNRWTANFTAKALEEYLRFIHLTIISEKSLKPSQIIDSIWKIHFTLDQDCWKQIITFLPEDLSRYPHPYKYAASYQHLYKQKYQETLQLYRQEFGEEPSNIIWGRLIFPEIRNEVNQTQKISTVEIAIMTMISLLFTFLAVTQLGSYGILVGFFIILIMLIIYIKANKSTANDPNRRNNSRDNVKILDYVDLNSSDDSIFHNYLNSSSDNNSNSSSGGYGNSDSGGSSGGGGSDSGGGGGE